MRQTTFRVERADRAVASLARFLKDIDDGGRLYERFPVRVMDSVARTATFPRFSSRTVRMNTVTLKQTDADASQSF